MFKEVVADLKGGWIYLELQVDLEQGFLAMLGYMEEDRKTGSEEKAEDEEMVSFKEVA